MAGFFRTNWCCTQLWVVESNNPAPFILRGWYPTLFGFSDLSPKSAINPHAPSVFLWVPWPCDHPSPPFKGQLARFRGPDSAASAQVHPGKWRCDCSGLYHVRGCGDRMPSSVFCCLVQPTESFVYYHCCEESIPFHSQPGVRILYLCSLENNSHQFPLNHIAAVFPFVF